MTKKHFIRLADIIKREGFHDPVHSEPDSVGLVVPVEALASFCREMNPNFNASRWYGYIKGECGPSGGNV